MIEEQHQFQHIIHPESYILIKQIDEWEKESIEKIQQRAKELRERLLQLTIAHTNQILNDLKDNLAAPSKIAINQYMSKPLVPNIYVVSTVINELFLRASGNKVRIEEDGLLAVHDFSIDTTEIQGRNAYTTGCHKIRLRIEQSTNKWTFLGINSKLTPLQNPPHPCPSSYGWTNNHTIWSNGNPKSSLPDKSIEMKNGDIIIA